MSYLEQKGALQSVRIFFSVLLCLTVSPLYADEATYKAAASQNSSFFKAPVNFNWAGPYVGGFVGATSANAHLKTNAGSVTSSSYFSSPSDIASVNQNGSHTLYPSAAIIGIQFGDNFLISHFFTAGVILDYSSFYLSKTSSVDNVFYPSASGSYSLQTSISTNWLYTIRGRLGFTPKTSWPLMIYGAGGLAVTNLKVSNNISDTSSLVGMGESSRRNNQTGWALGGGVEFPVIQHLTINAEYSYLHFGNLNTSGSIQNSAEGFGINANSLASPLATSVSLHANFFKIGLNYKF